MPAGASARLRLMPSEGYFFLVAAGLAAGILNTLAGGGSFLTIPALIFLGLDANAANGTNRIGVLLQSGIAATTFARRGRLPGRDAFRLVPVTVAGALAGARVAVDIPAPVLRGVLAAVILIALPAVFIPEGRSGGGSSRAGAGAPAESAAGPGSRNGRAGGSRRALLLQLAFLGIGFYGGFLQAGVGFLILGALVPLAGLDLVRANALKVTIVAFHTALALPVFIAHRQVELAPGLILAAGTMLGAWIGTHLAVLRGARFVRWVLLAALLISAAQLLELPARLLR